jgi:hypothetical protein
LSVVISLDCFKSPEKWLEVEAAKGITKVAKSPEDREKPDLEAVANHDLDHEPRINDDIAMVVVAVIEVVAEVIEIGIIVIEPVEGPAQIRDLQVQVRRGKCLPPGLFR